MHKGQNAGDVAQSATPRFLGGGTHEAPAGQDFPPHAHTAWELVYYRRGHVQAPIGGDTFDVGPGVLLLTPPNVVHAEYPRTDYANFFVGVEAPADQPWPRTCRDDAEGTLGHLFAALVREWHTPSEERERMLPLLTEQLDLFLRRASRQGSPAEGERLVGAAERLIRERHARPLCLRDLAREIGSSPSALRQHFTRLRGQSPREALQAVRLNHALALIRSSTLTLETVAAQCGYDSASHLSRCVKRSTGHSPGRLRGTHP